MESSLFGDELDLLYPIIEEGGSDSAAFDNVLELLVVNGVLSLPEAVMMMVPEAWQDNPLMNPDKKAFYQWAACQMEPWDGPALFTFSDGRYCGANLDRNGLRPCRFYVTSDDMMICASEVGTIAVDTVEGRIVDDKELKRMVASKQNFKEWIANQMLSLPKVKHRLRRRGETLSENLDDFKLASDPRLLAFGYTFEQINLLLAPMVVLYRDQQLTIGRRWERGSGVHG
jgi:glutamate synthase (NADPH/NADH)